MSTIAASVIDASSLQYRELNLMVRSAIARGEKDLVLRNVCGQRYIGAGLSTDASILIEGIPGNDLAAFMNGPVIRVQGNVQDGVGNTMSSGTVAVDGDAGDVLGYAMRGGRIFVRGEAGYRVGIHMKEYGPQVPTIVIGGTVRDYFGEYMAGGTLVLLGLDVPPGEPLAGDFLGTGMHGGDIYVRGAVEDWQLGREVGRVPIDDAAWTNLSLHLDAFRREFGLSDELPTKEEFTRLRPVSRRPYGRIYVY